MEYQFLQEIKQSYYRLKILGQRHSINKYSLIFAFENFYNSDLIYYKNIDLRDHYNKLIYKNERQIFEDLKGSYSSTFNSYIAKFQRINYNDVCQEFIPVSEKQRLEGL